MRILIACGTIERLPAQQFEPPQCMVGSSQVTVDEAVHIYVVTTRPAIRIVIECVRRCSAKIHEPFGSKLRVPCEHSSSYLLAQCEISRF